MSDIFIPIVVGSRSDVELLCCHCSATVLTVKGYGALEFCRRLPGRLICEECDEQVKRGEVMPLRAIRETV